MLDRSPDRPFRRLPAKDGRSCAGAVPPRCSGPRDFLVPATLWSPRQSCRGDNLVPATLLSPRQSCPRDNLVPAKLSSPRQSCPRNRLSGPRPRPCRYRLIRSKERHGQRRREAGRALPALADRIVSRPRPRPRRPRRSRRPGARRARFGRVRRSSEPLKGRPSTILRQIFGQIKNRSLSKGRPPPLGTRKLFVRCGAGGVRPPGEHRVSTMAWPEKAGCHGVSSTAWP